MSKKSMTPTIDKTASEVSAKPTPFVRLPQTIKPPNMVYSTTPWVEEERQEGQEPGYQDFQSGLLFDSEKVYVSDPENADKFKEYVSSLV